MFTRYMQPNSKPPLLASVCVSAFAMFVAFTAARVQGPISRPIPHGDAFFYLDLGQSLAAGKGYVATQSPWPGKPHVARLPLWPAFLAPMLWLSQQHVAPVAVLRIAGIFLHGISSGLLVLITWWVWRDLSGAVLAGILSATYLPGLSLATEGFSETVAMAMALTGVLLLLCGGWKQIMGAFIFGLSVLARGNMALLPAAAAVTAVLWWPRPLRHWKRFVLLAAIFFLPTAFWICRNYAVSGAFPLLSAQEGETFYGANNSTVRTYVFNYGFYNLPDDIPGERPKKELAQKMTEVELDRYYRRKGLEYIRQSWFVYPFLIMGKLMRGFVPIPMYPTMSLYAGSLARWFLYAVFLWSLRQGIVRRDLYGLAFASVFVVTLATTVIYYGTYRFTFPLEVLMFPASGVLLARIYRQWRGSSNEVVQPAANVA